MVLFLLLAAAQAQDGNLIVNPGLESEPAFDWRPAGEKTVAQRVQTRPHTGAWCLYVRDDGNQWGQGNNARFAAAPGLYYAEAWVRVDSECPGVTMFDVQFVDAQGKYLPSQKVGTTASTQWERLWGVVSMPANAVAVRLRLLPTAPSRELRGACFADDFYLAPLATAVAQGKMRVNRQPCANEDPDGLVGEPPSALADKPLTPQAQVDFEDLSGWTMEAYGDLTAAFCRSREQQVGGRFVGKLTYATKGGRSWVSIRPAQPVAVPDGSDAAQIWAYSDCHAASYRNLAVPTMTLVIVEAGKERLIPLPPFRWSFWSIAHQRLDRPIGPDARLVELRVEDLATDEGKPRQLFFDELSFHREPTDRLDLAIPDVPCPTRPETVLPAFKARHKNEASAQGGVFRLAYRGDDGTVEYRYKPQTGSLDDLEVTLDGLTFRPAAGGGPMVATSGRDLRVGDDGLAAELLSCMLDGRSASEDAPAAGDRLRAQWRYRVGEEAATVSWDMRIIGKSLVLTVDEPTGRVSRWLFGKPDGAKTREIDVPYLNLTHAALSPGVQLVGERAFVFCQPDWYVTHASLFADDGCHYVPKVGGGRVPLHERLFLTVSTDFQEVLPTIANPKSPYAHVLGENVYLQMPGVDRWERGLALLRQMKRLGLEKCIVKHHAETWSAHSGKGNEPFVLTTTAASHIPGGETALINYIRDVKALGFQYFLYTDYCLIGPVNRCFDEGLVALGPDGAWRVGWYQYSVLNPLAAATMAGTLAPQIAAKYGNTGSYCDQHTARTPWGWVDYDPRKPGAAMLQTVFRAYCKVFQAEKDAYRGPAVSEGHRYWYYAGMSDGNYAQLAARPGQQPWQAPFLVDFDLLKIHPLEVDLGMGWRDSYGYDPHAKSKDDALDRFLCATIAFGHSGIRYGRWGRGLYSGPFDPDDPLAEKKRVVARTYFMIQQLASRYALVPVRSIAYWDGARLVDTSEAIRSGAVRRSQVAVEYENGLRVFANGSFTEAWRVTADGQTYDLPPNGWLAAQGREFLEYSALRDGRRVDFVRSPVYTFADGRGAPTDFGDLKATNAVVVLHQRGGERHEIDAPMDW